MDVEALESGWQALHGLSESDEEPAAHLPLPPLPDTIGIRAGFEAIVADPVRPRVGNRQDAAKNARKVRAGRLLVRQKKRRKEDYNALAGAWDSAFGLRCGEQVDRGQKVGGHSNRWSMTGLLRLGFQGVGKAAACRGGVGESTHMLDALLSTCRLAQHAQERAFATRLEESLSSPNPGIVICRSHDATPMQLNFGKLQSQLYELARYPIEIDGKWKSVTYKEMTEAPRGTTGKWLRTPAHGTLEVFAQTCEISWGTDAGKRDDKLILLPAILENTRASTLFRAYESACPGLDIDGLKDISARTSAFIVSEVPDHAPTNVRKVAATASSMPDRCLYDGDRYCAAHRVVRVVEHLVQGKHFIGDIHSIAVTCGVPRHHSLLMAQVRNIVARELEILPIGDPRWDEHRATVLNHTIGRQRVYSRTRTAVDNDDDQDRPCKDAHRVRLIDTFLNGDWRLDKVQHVERGCCASWEDQVSNVTNAIVQGGLVGGLSSDRPSKNRWGTVAHHLAGQCLGHMAHNILGRALQAAFPKWDSAGKHVKKILPNVFNRYCVFTFS